VASGRLWKRLFSGEVSRLKLSCGFFLLCRKKAGFSVEDTTPPQARMRECQVHD